MNPRALEKRLIGIGNQMRDQDQQNYCFVEIDRNPEKNQGDLRSVTVTQTPMKDR